jgi:drug/metabolite transporter (DMT)-like permease
MPDRAIIPLFVAIAAGFIAGTIAAITESYGGTVVVIGVLVGIVVLATGVASVVKAEGEESERWIVGALRGLVAAACFGFLYVGIFYALRDGSPLGVLSVVVAGFFAVLLTRFRVRDRGELHPGHPGGRPDHGRGGSPDVAGS